jgi:uncharacterized protein YcfL
MVKCPAVASLTVVLAMLMIGCRASVNTTSGRLSDHGSIQTSTHVGDWVFGEEIKVDDIVIQESNAVKTIAIKLKNWWHYDLVLEAKMDFFDADGVTIDNAWGWKPVTVNGYQYEWVKFTAPNESVKFFRLSMKKAEYNE